MTTSLQIVYWRDIPAQVKARAGRTRLARPLSDRFQQAIDEAAMRAGKSDSESYLEEWRAAEAPERDETPETAVESVVAELEAAYPQARLSQLAANGGRES